MSNKNNEKNINIDIKINHEQNTERYTEKNNKVLKAFIAAFPHTIPVLAGYGFLGLSYGIFTVKSGFAFYYPIIMAFVIYGGSLEFVAVSMLLSSFAPIQTFLMAFSIQVRHLFYGISMLGKYKNMGWKKFHLIFGLSDETFAINGSVQVPDGVDSGWFYLWITWLDRFYWVGSTALGAILGATITFNAEGLDFVMTAMFIVIFLDHFMKEKQHYSSIIGIVATVACRIGFGADSFIIPSMLCILLALTIFKKPIQRKAGDIE